MNNNKSDSKKFLAFIFPSYFPLLLIACGIVSNPNIWSEAGLVTIVLAIIGILVTGVFLVKKQFWFSIFMIIYGIFLVIDSKNHDFVFQIIELYGYYLIIHFLICSVYVFYKAKK